MREMHKGVWVLVALLVASTAFYLLATPDAGNTAVSEDPSVSSAAPASLQDDARSNNEEEDATVIVVGDMGFAPGEIERISFDAQVELNRIDRSAGLSQIPTPELQVDAGSAEERDAGDARIALLGGPPVTPGARERNDLDVQTELNPLESSAGRSPVATSEDPDMTPVENPRVAGQASSGGQQPSLEAIVSAAAALAGNPLDARSAIPQTGTSPQAVEYAAERPFSASTDCKFCHPRQYQEWRTSPHSYSGISPTFYSLVSAGQNSFGAGALINANDGVSQGGAVGNFCLPCHSPMSFVGLEGRFSGNNGGFSDVQPQGPFVCNTASGDAAFEPCTVDTSAEICGLSGRCNQFEGRTCVNMPSVTEGTDFPRVQLHCTEDADCSGSGSGCPSGEDCGPCIIAPATIYYSNEAQEGINCESCHNILPNHRRACQQFRNSDSVGVLSIDLQERDLDGTRLRLGPYPADLTDQQIADGLGIAGDRISPRRNAFHESARVETPLGVPYLNTDYAGGVRNPLNTDPEVLRPTSVTCEELPYCRSGLCEGGTNIGATCGSGPDADFNCGGCSSGGTCGLGGARAGMACRTSVDCATPADASMNVMDRGIEDGTLGPLFATETAPGVHQLDRPDANYYRSSMFCGTCHDVRPPFGNPILRSCELQDTHVCSTDADCEGLNIGCEDNDCGPCVMENGSAPGIDESAAGSDPAVGDPRNTGVRRV